MRDDHGTRSAYMGSRNNFSSVNRYNVKLQSFELSPLRDIMPADLQELYGQAPGVYII